MDHGKSRADLYASGQVRALEWRSAGYDGQTLEASALGLKVFYRVHGKPGCWTLTSPGASEYVHTPGYETRAYAQAAAQVDYERRILAALTPAPQPAGEAVPVAWLPDATIEWLKSYDGPACATKTAAHIRPLKSGRGKPVYLHQPQPSVSITEAAVDAAYKALPPDAHGTIGSGEMERVLEAAFCAQLGRPVNDALKRLVSVLDQHEGKGPLPDTALMFCWMAAQDVRAALRALKGGEAND